MEKEMAGEDERSYFCLWPLYQEISEVRCLGCHRGNISEFANMKLRLRCKYWVIAVWHLQRQPPARRTQVGAGRHSAEPRHGGAVRAEDVPRVRPGLLHRASYCWHRPVPAPSMLGEVCYAAAAGVWPLQTVGRNRQHSLQPTRPVIAGSV